LSSKHNFFARLAATIASISTKPHFGSIGFSSGSQICAQSLRVREYQGELRIAGNFRTFGSESEMNEANKLRGMEQTSHREL